MKHFALEILIGFLGASPNLLLVSQYKNMCSLFPSLNNEYFTIRTFSSNHSDKGWGPKQSFGYNSVNGNLALEFLSFELH